jgi:membrane protein
MSSSEVIPAVSAESEKHSGYTLLWKALQKFMGDDCPRMAAALAFYTVFSLPPLLVLLVLITSTFVEAGAIEQVLQGQIGGLLGPEGAAQVQSMIRNVERPGAGGPVATLLGSLAFLFGATASFAQLQGAERNLEGGAGPHPRRRQKLLPEAGSFLCDDPGYWISAHGVAGRERAGRSL